MVELIWKEPQWWLWLNTLEQAFGRHDCCYPDKPPTISMNGETSGTKKRDWLECNTYINVPERHDWFDAVDLSRRCILVTLSFYWVVVTHPRHLAIQFRQLPKFFKQLLVVSLFTPITVFVVVCNNNVYKKIISRFDIDDHPGKFTKKRVYVIYNIYAYYVSAILISESTKKKDLWSKSYYHSLFSRLDMPHPRKIGNWNGKTLEIDAVLPKKIIVKREYGSRSIGDIVLERDECRSDGKFSKKNDVVPFKTSSDVERLLAASLDGFPAVLLEFYEPLDTLETHMIGIDTFKVSDESIKVIASYIWCDCTGSTSRTAATGFMIDVRTNRTVSTMGHRYKSYERTSFRELVIPHIQTACEMACKAHREIGGNVPFMGWDCMITDDRRLVFFEGNPSRSRLARYIFSSFEQYLLAIEAFQIPLITRPLRLLYRS